MRLGGLVVLAAVGVAALTLGVMHVTYMASGIVMAIVAFPACVATYVALVMAGSSSQGAAVGAVASLVIGYVLMSAYFIAFLVH